MYMSTLHECERLAKELLERAALVTPRVVWPQQASEGVHAAALRRTSMDLTRALARLRGGK